MEIKINTVADLSNSNRRYLMLNFQLLQELVVASFGIEDFRLKSNLKENFIDTILE